MRNLLGWQGQSRVRALRPRACRQGFGCGVAAGEVLEGLAGARSVVVIERADVSTGDTAKNLQRQALADKGQGQVADGIGSGRLCRDGWRSGSKGHGALHGEKRKAPIPTG